LSEQSILPPFNSFSRRNRNARHPVPALNIFLSLLFSVEAAVRKNFLIIAGIVLGVLVLVLGIRVVSKRGAAKGNAQQPAQPALSERATPADRQINAAQGIIKQAPGSPGGYDLLAAAYMQKARETADFNFYAKADAALKRSLELDSEGHAAIRLRAYLLLSYHRFGEALEVAQRALQQSPRDYEAYGALVDALVELGKYDEAKKAVQEMVNLRPYTASYARASYLRSLYGDTQGAIDAMRLAAESASPADPEGMAWCYVHLGDELLNAGKLNEAEHEYDHALFIFPDYHLGLAAKARARVAAGDLEGGVSYYQKALERVPLPDTAAALGDLLTKLGRADEAKKQYELVEFTERTSAAGSTYSRQLALFYADHDIKLDEALSIARRERELRDDIFTSDALAWSLYKKGELAEARKYIEEALRLGTRDARLNYHAGMIYQAVGQRLDAARYLQLALKINPSFDVLQADVAKQTLRSLSA
jgi:pentatricopeptide repeat protein